jgi:hypothetical protein
MVDKAIHHTPPYQRKNPSEPVQAVGAVPRASMPSAMANADLQARKHTRCARARLGTEHAFLESDFLRGWWQASRDLAPRKHGLERPRRIAGEERPHSCYDSCSSDHSASSAATVVARDDGHADARATRARAHTAATRVGSADGWQSQSSSRDMSASPTPSPAELLQTFASADMVDQQSPRWRTAPAYFAEE